MEWIQRNPKRAVGLAALSVLVVIVLVWVLSGGSRGQDDKAMLGGPPLATPTATPTRHLTLAPMPSSTPSGSSLGIGGAGSSGAFNLEGFPGGSMYKNLPRHQVVLRVTSDAPIGTVGYVIPTSLKHSSGVVKNVGTRWSLTTPVYGKPDYARIWLQAGSRGYPITCVITVDGRETERRSTDGPYGQLICQG